MGGCIQKTGLCPDGAEPSAEEIAEIERRKAEVQARWSEQVRESKAVCRSRQPADTPVISVSEMMSGCYGSRRRSTKE